MIDERIKELINGDLDEELSLEERAELEAALASSDEAREFQASMQTLDSMLSALPEQSLDRELHEAIVDDLPATSNVVPIANGASSSKISSMLSYGLATAAGILVAVAYYEARTPTAPAQDISQMVGTMAPGVTPSRTIDSIDINEGGIRSNASVQQRGDATVLDVAIDSSDTVEITVDFDNTSLRFDALAQLDSQFDSFLIAGQRIQVRSQGRQRFTVLMHRNGNKQSDDKEVVTLRYLRDGTLVKQDTLDIG